MPGRRLFRLVVLALTITGCGRSDRRPVRQAANIETDVRRFDFGSGALEPRYAEVHATTRYTDSLGFGFMDTAALSAGSSGSGEALNSDFVMSEQPFYFSVDLPEGNYRVTVTLGGTDNESVVTVKAESRRLMLERVAIAPGRTVTEIFAVNIRNYSIAGGGEVRLKDREIGAFHWDDRLTLEFSGEYPSVAALEIAPAPDVVTVFLAGNSTVTDQTAEPWAAWGQMLPRFFSPEVAIANHAESGETLKAFVGENRLKKLLSQIGPGDFLFIQFAHNDQKPGTSHVEPFTGYKKYLSRFIEEARTRGARTVLVTSMHRRRFDESGHVVNTLGDYPEAMRQTAREENVALIDLNAMSALFYEALGPEKSKKAFVHYAAGTFPGQNEELKDDTHHSTYGAYELARAVVQGIRTNVPALTGSLRSGVGTFDPAHPDDPESWYLPPSSRVAVEKPEGN